MDTKVCTGKQLEEPHAALERALIAEFLAERGHTLPSLARLPTNQHRELLTAATTYATLKLSEIESRARFVEEIEQG